MTSYNSKLLHQVLPDVAYTINIFRTIVHRIVFVSQTKMLNFTITLAINLAISNIGKCRTGAVSVVNVVVVQVTTGVHVTTVSVVVVEVVRRDKPKGPKTQDTRF